MSIFRWSWQDIVSSLASFPGPKRGRRRKGHQIFRARPAAALSKSPQGARKKFGLGTRLGRISILARGSSVGALRGEAIFSPENDARLVISVGNYDAL